MIRPKLLRIRSEKLLRATRGSCQGCGKGGQFPAHHIVHRSHQRLDVPENLMTLCEVCHRLVHADGQYEAHVVARAKTAEQLERLRELAPTCGIWARLEREGR